MLNSLAVDLSDARHHNKKKAHTANAQKSHQKCIRCDMMILWFCPMTLCSMFEHISWKSVCQKKKMKLLIKSLPFAFLFRWAIHSVAFAYRCFCYPLMFVVAIFFFAWDIRFFFFYDERINVCLLLFCRSYRVAAISYFCLSFFNSVNIAFIEIFRFAYFFALSIHTRTR